MSLGLGQQLIITLHVVGPQSVQVVPGDLLVFELGTVDKVAVRAFVAVRAIRAVEHLAGKRAVVPCLWQGPEHVLYLFLFLLDLNELR